MNTYVIILLVCIGIAVIIAAIFIIIPYLKSKRDDQIVLNIPLDILSITLADVVSSVARNIILQHPYLIPLKYSIIIRSAHTLFRALFKKHAKYGIFWDIKCEDFRIYLKSVMIEIPEYTDLTQPEDGMAPHTVKMGDCIIPDIFLDSVISDLLHNYHDVKYSPSYQYELDKAKKEDL